MKEQIDELIKHNILSFEQLVFKVEELKHINPNGEIIIEQEIPYEGEILTKLYDIDDKLDLIKFKEFYDKIYISDDYSNYYLGIYSLSEFYYQILWIETL